MGSAAKGGLEVGQAGWPEVAQCPMYHSKKMMSRMLTSESLCGKNKDTQDDRK